VKKDVERVGDGDVNKSKIQMELETVDKKHCKRKVKKEKRIKKEG